MTESNKRTTSAAKVTIVLVSIALLVMAYTFVGYAGPPMVEIVNESSTVLADVVLIGGTGQWEIPVGDIPSGATETVHVSQIEDWLDECEISIRFAVGGREYYRDDCGALLSSGYAYKIRLVVSEGLETRPHFMTGRSSWEWLAESLHLQRRNK